MWFNSLLVFSSILIVRWNKATELSHQVSPVIVVNSTYHWKSPPNQRPKIAFRSCMMMVISLQGRWNMWVTGLHL